MSIDLSERIKQCLYCPVCHKTLRLYYSFVKSAYRKYPANGTQFSESDRDSITKLGNLLHVKGSVEKQYEVLHRLMERPKRNVDNELGCLYILNRILFELRQLYGIMDFEDFSAFSGKIMNEIYKVIHGNYPDKTFFSISKNKTNHQEQLSRRKKEFISYCYLNTNGKPKLKYKYCSQEYEDMIKDSSNKIADCQGAYFLAISQQLDPTENKGEFVDISPLTDTSSWDICLEYLKHAPKHFGKNLSLVIERQGLSLADVASIMKEKENESSLNTIAALCACKTPRHNKSYLHRLARCLLVSDEVLISGTGESYGNWENVFSSEGMETIKHFKNKKTLKGAERWTRSEIRNWLSLSDSEFETLMLDNPTFFKKEPFCGYEQIADREIIIDVITMRINLLHPEEFNVLAKVLLDKNNSK